MKKVVLVMISAILVGTLSGCERNINSNENTTETVESQNSKESKISLDLNFDKLSDVSNKIEDASKKYDEVTEKLEDKYISNVKEKINNISDKYNELDVSGKINQVNDKISELDVSSKVDEVSNKIDEAVGKIDLVNDVLDSIKGN